MSYNITNWRTTKLYDFAIPLSAFKDGHWFSVQIKQNEDGQLTLNISGYAEGFNIKGVLVDDMVFVHEIGSYGEGSGTFQSTLIKALKQSSGELCVLLVWEGGEYIERLIVKDGEVQEIPFDD